MSADLDDASFWTSWADPQKSAHSFTSFYGIRAWEHASLPAGAKVLDIAARAGEEVINTKHIMAGGHQSIAEMAAQEAGASSDEDAARLSVVVHGDSRKD